MAWKRRVHAEHGTTLVESTWAEVVFGDGLTKLEDGLTRLGLSFDWDPERLINDEWAKPVKDEDVARLVRAFMAHVKSNSWSAGALEARLGSELAQLDGFRARLFFELYWQVHAEWERKLAAEGSIDFEDMLVRAAGHLEAGDVDCPYELVMVDELQDASRARARLVKALVKAPGRFLLAVGDDWQSTFVTKNPAQFKKPMRSAQRDRGLPVKVVQADDPARALVSYLEDLSSQVADARVVRNGGGTVSVDVLGRYWHERDVLPRRPPSNLKVTFRTVHSSKELEVDYIVLPGLTTGRYGFPSDMADDPVLDLAMPAPEAFPHAEERRLFYVALTRARREVTVITSPGAMSPFVVELLDDSHVTVTGTVASPVKACPECGRGTMVRRKGKFGSFLGCSAFPACRHTRNLYKPPGNRVAARAGLGFRRTGRAAPLQLDLDVGTAPA